MTTKTKKKPSLKGMTLRQAWQAYYPKDHINVTSHRHKINAIERAFPEAATASVTDIDDDWMARLRVAIESHGYSPSTVKHQLGWALALLNYLGPRDSGNPRAIGLLPARVYVRRPTLYLKLPRRISLDDISKVYIASQRMNRPCFKGCLAQDWWRAYLVTAYATGLRRGDLLAIRWDQLTSDDESQQHTLTVTADKTRKTSVFPLPQYVLDHWRRIYSADEPLVFRGYLRQQPGRQSRYMRQLCELAGVDSFSSHDIRRTACAEVERARPGIGSVFLQHRPSSVTSVYYLNSSPELREAIEKMRVPVGFKAGPSMSNNQDRQFQKARLNPEHFAPKWKPLEQADWEFSPGLQFAYRGQWFRLQSIRYTELLKIFVVANDSLTRGEIHAALTSSTVAKWTGGERTITTLVARLRGRLRKEMGLKTFDPLPAVMSHSNKPTAWRLQLPPWLT